jgi:hypothetical protein
MGWGRGGRLNPAAASNILKLKQVRSPQFLGENQHNLHAAMSRSAPEPRGPSFCGGGAARKGGPYRINIQSTGTLA